MIYVAIYVYIFRVTSCTWCEDRVREFSVYVEFWMVNVDVTLSLPPVYFVCVDGVDRSCYVPRQEPVCREAGRVRVCVLRCVATGATLDAFRFTFQQFAYCYKQLQYITDLKNVQLTACSRYFNTFVSLVGCHIT